MSSSSAEIGRRAEQAAAQHLLEAGLSLLARNYSCRLGELDLVMQDSNQLVFVEVRYRGNNQFGSPLESITPTKQRKLRAAANVYLKQLSKQPSARFDAVGVSPSSKAGQEFNIVWCKNAF